MKVLVAVDIEGIAGVVHPDQARPGNADYERARRWMTAGVLAHTINGTAFARVFVDGGDVGELALYGAVAAEFGAPVAFVSGDDRCVAEAAALFPNAVGVAVKTAHGHRSATSLSPSAACAAIETGARMAAERIPALRIAPQKTPLTVRVQAANPAHADLFAMLPLVRRVDAVTLEFTSPTMRHAVRVLNALSAMSFMLR